MNYYTYIMTNLNNKVLYIGFTNDLVRRVYEHRNNLIEGFTKMYRVHKLVYYEIYSSSYDAIAREKQLKGWTRKKKIALIEKDNAEWKDLWDVIYKFERLYMEDGLNIGQILRLQSLTALSLRMTKWEGVRFYRMTKWARGRSYRVTALGRVF